LYGSGRRTIHELQVPAARRRRAAPEAGGSASAPTSPNRRRREGGAAGRRASPCRGAKGDAVFQELTRYLAVILNAELGADRALSPTSRPRTVQGRWALFGGGAYRENFEYPPRTSRPAATWVDGSFSVVPRDVGWREYPQDEYLANDGRRGLCRLSRSRTADGNIAGGPSPFRVEGSRWYDQHLIESVLKIFRPWRARRRARAGATTRRGLRKERVAVPLDLRRPTTDSAGAARRRLSASSTSNPAYEAMSGRQSAPRCSAPAPSP